MRALLALVGLIACFLYAEPSLTDEASADAPNLDDDVRTISATANYQLSPTIGMSVGGGELVSHSTNTKEYFAGVAILSSAGGNSFVDLLDASALFDSLPLHGGVNGAKLDVTLPVTYCILDSCPTTLEVSLVWQPDGKPTRDSSSARIDTDSCHFTVIRQSSNATAIVTGFVSDGTSHLASGQTSGTVTEGRERLVGFGDPAVCR
ncbi:MAG: hypothetical protein E6I03_12930 [Chloroflexi bacterium]|nr:MAG: hypothetical protein E6I03_12930 [Chloroflexota bacterium]